MELLETSAVQVKLFSLPQSRLRFIIGEYTDSNDWRVMSFLKCRKAGYEVTNIPQPLKPSYELADYLHSILETEQHLYLKLPDGTYWDGPNFFTMKAARQEVPTMLLGRKIESVSLGGIEYDLVSTGRIAFLGMVYAQIPKGVLWRVLPEPQDIRQEEVDYLIGTAEQAGVPYVQSKRTNRLQ